MGNVGGFRVRVGQSGDFYEAFTQRAPRAYVLGHSQLEKNAAPARKWPKTYALCDKPGKPTPAARSATYRRTRKSPAGISSGASEKESLAFFEAAPKAVL